MSKSSGAGSRSSGASSNPSGRSINQADCDVDRDAVNDRLANIEDMLGRLQNVLDDVQVNQDADEPGGDQGHHNGAALARGSMSDKLWLKERITAWKNANIRAFWLLCSEKPKGCDLSRVQLQGVFKNSALASSAVVEQLNALAGLDVTAFMPRGPEPGTADTIDIEKQFAILAKVLLLVVIGRDITSGEGKARVEKIRKAFEDGVELVASHVEANNQAIQVPVHRARIARFINKDPEDWTTAVHDAALSAKSNWHEPPGIEELPGAVLRTWAKVRAYIDAGGLDHVDIHKDPVATREKGGRAAKRVRRDADSAQLEYFDWASQRGCRFERRGEPCKYRHDPADKFRGKKQGGGGASGAAHKKTKAGVGTAPVAPASGDGGESGKRGGSAKSSKGAD